MPTKLKDLQDALLATCQPLDPAVLAAVTAWCDNLASALVSATPVPGPPPGPAGPHVAPMSVGAFPPVSTPVPGQFHLDPSGGTLRVFDGSAWKAIALT